MKRILAIDPGTSCGWAFRETDGRIVSSGAWNLAGRRFEGGGMRIIRLRQHMATFWGNVDLVAFEEVRRHLGTDAAHIYGAITGEIMAACEEHHVPYLAVPVGTVKKLATGKGNADKTAMVAAARARWAGWAELRGSGPGLEDEADARWIAEAAALEVSAA